MTENFLLETIADNPYQPRTVDNTEHIENLARSIAADGLLQIPTARLTTGNVQLAFGHSRRKAFEWLRENYEKAGLPDRYNGYRNMPLNIEDLSDEDMYRQAISENVQRKDLDAIEVAKAMLVYRDQFGKNSDEIGALFGMSGATVRGKLRLLDLPDTVKEKLQSGELSENAARMLITLGRMAPDSVSDALEMIVEDHEDPEETVDSILRSRNDVKRILEENFSLKAKSFKHLPVLSEKELSKLDDEEKKQHLLTPPACTACPFYAKVGGDDYCSWVQCFDRKTEAQAAANVEDASKKTGIAIYSEADGEMIGLDRWEETHRKAVSKNDPDLRLTKTGKIQSYWHYINNDIPMNVAVVAVGKLRAKYEKARVQSQIDRGQIPTDADPKEKARAIKAQTSEQVARDAYDRIVFETLAPYFVPLLDPIKNEGLLELFADVLSPDNELFDRQNEAKLIGKARIKHLQTAIFSELWERATSWDARRKSYEAKQPASELAKTARVLAEKWGIKLGKDFEQAISAADARVNEARAEAIESVLAAVSVETPAKKKK